MGESKGWAKGKTAATDRRVARAAASHRGMAYIRRTPVDLCRWRRPAGAPLGRTLPLEWSPTMAYVVGLMATDGCLITGRRQLNFKSEDRQLVETFLACLGMPTRVASAPTKTGKRVYFRQFGDASLYRWLESVGLTPRKSLTLGPITVPPDLLPHCARGLLDGDGSLLNYRYAGGGKAVGRTYEALVTRFFSASLAHIEWLRAALGRLASVVGSVNRPEQDEPGWQLNYAIRESRVLLPILYPDREVPRLERKWSLWLDYASRHGLAPTLREATDTDRPPSERPTARDR